MSIEQLRSLADNPNNSLRPAMNSANAKEDIEKLFNGLRHTIFNAGMKYAPMFDKTETLSDPRMMDATNRIMRELKIF